MLRLDITVNGKLESWEEYQPERIATNADILGAARERMRADGWVQTDYRNPDDDTVEILYRRGDETASITLRRLHES